MTNQSHPFFLIGEDSFGFPRSAVTQTFAFVGKRESGKTYAAGRFVEELIDKGAQVIIVDPVGNWFGLRLALDGRSQGIPIPVFGGLHGDLMLHHLTGGAVGRYIAQHKMSAILDVSQFTGGEQRKFVEAFAREFYETKKKFPSAVMIVWEESQLFVPQRVGPAEAPMVGAMERLSKIGRNYGIGTSLLGQRPQSINKDVLNQTECFFTFQLVAPHERKAVAEWMNHAGISKENITELAEIPRLKKGEALVSSPSWLETCRRIKILPKRTLDFSKTPDFASFNEVAVPLKLPVTALRELQALMEAAIQDVVEKDVKLLQKQVKELRAELEEARQHKVEQEIHRIEIPVILGEDISTLQVASSLINEVVSKLGSISGDLTNVLGNISDRMGEVLKRSANQAPIYTPAKMAISQAVNINKPSFVNTKEKENSETVPKKITVQGQVSGETYSLHRGERDILYALAARHPAGYTKNQLATITGFSTNWGGFNNYRYKLRKYDLITWSGPDGEISITKKGKALIPNNIPLRTSAEILDMWLTSLSGTGKCKEILQHYYDARGREISIKEMAKMVNMSTTRGGFKNYFYTLTSNGLIVKGKDGHKISDAFLPPQ